MTTLDIQMTLTNKESGKSVSTTKQLVSTENQHDWIRVANSTTNMTEQLVTELNKLEANKDA